MFGINSIKGKYVTIALKDEPVQNYIELRPPQGVNDKTKIVNMIVVLDCSGSMRGPRMRMANKILSQLFNCPEVNSLSVIRFGTEVFKPIIYDKFSKQFTDQEADLGENDFVLACDELVEALKNVNEHCETMALFISDGGIDQDVPPEETFEKLYNMLKQKNVSLQSIAISDHANPKIMIRLATMNGNLSMILLKDDMTDDECIDKFFKEVGSVGLIDELKVDFYDKKTHEVLKSEVLRYRRGEDVIGLISPENKTVDDLDLVVELEDVKYNIALEDVNLSNDYAHKASFLCSYILNESKKLIGKYVMKEIPIDVARTTITKLKTLYTSHFDEKTILDKIIKENTINGQLSPEGKSKMRQLKKDIKSINLATLETLNQHLRIVEDNDLGKALEAFSGQKVTSKFNQRLLDIAAKNRNKQELVVAKQDVEHLLNNNKSLPDCVIWLCNPLDTAKDSFDDIEQNEWVGNAAFVDPGKIAAISPWNLKSVVLRPLKITNTAIDLIRADGNEKRKAWLNGYDVEFNTSIPLIDPLENEDAVRLVLHFMRRSTEGNREISKIITSVPDLYNPAMVNALYTTATLSTLKEAKSAIDYELGFKAFLTLLDSNFYQNKDKKNCDYFEKLLQDVLADPVKFISRKEEDELPNISRSMMFLNTVNGSFTLDKKKVNEIFLRLFARVCSDQTSQQYTIEAVTGVDLATCMQEISKLLINLQGKKIKDITEPKLPFGTMNDNVKLCFSKLFSIYGIHKIIREYLEKEKISLEEFYKRILHGQISMDQASSLFKGAQQYIKMKPQEFLRLLTNDDTIDTHRVYQAILTICCHNHTSGLVNHDSAHNEYVLSRCGSIEDILRNAELIKDAYLSSHFASQAKKTKRLLRIRQKILKWVENVRELKKKYPLEKLRHVFEDHSLSYSDAHDEFQTRHKMFNYLNDFGFKDEDLDSLHEIPIEHFVNFDLHVWKKNHKYHLYGFYNYAPQLIEKSNSIQEFINLIHEALEKHYSGEIHESHKREFTSRMRDYVPEFAGHYYEEYHINEFLQNIKHNQDGHTIDTIRAEVYEICTSMNSLDDTRRRYREEHVDMIIKEKLGLVV